jgi:hypothetical protein
MGMFYAEPCWASQAAAAQAVALGLDDERDDRVEANISDAITEMLREGGNDLAYVLQCVESDGQRRSVAQMLDRAGLPKIDGLCADDWLRLLLTCPAKNAALYLLYFRDWADRHLRADRDMLESITRRAEAMVKAQDEDAAQDAAEALL